MRLLENRMFFIPEWIVSNIIYLSSVSPIAHTHTHFHVYSLTGNLKLVSELFRVLFDFSSRFTRQSRVRRHKRVQFSRKFSFRKFVLCMLDFLVFQKENDIYMYFCFLFFFSFFERVKLWLIGSRKSNLLRVNKYCRVAVCVRERLLYYRACIYICKDLDSTLYSHRISRPRENYEKE